MRSFRVELTGKSPLLMHYDNIEWASILARWRTLPKNKDKSVPGDDRSPAFAWIGSLYTVGSPAVVAIPSDNIMRCAMEGAAMVPVPKGKNGVTFKRQSQSGMLPIEVAWPLKVNEAEVPFTEIWRLREE